MAHSTVPSNVWFRNIMAIDCGVGDLEDKEPCTPGRNSGPECQTIEDMLDISKGGPTGASKASQHNRCACGDAGCWVNGRVRQPMTKYLGT